MGKVSLVSPGTWEVDSSRSTVGFDVRHLKITKVHGWFREFAGFISCDREGAASIEGTVAVGSIDTGDERRDARLRSEEFFDVEHHPAIGLTAFSHPVRSERVPIVRGTMTMLGTSRPFDLQVETPASPTSANGDLRIRAHGTVSRREFGLEWDSAFAAGGLVIDDRVRLGLDIVLARPTPPSRRALVTSHPVRRR